MNKSYSITRVAAHMSSFTQAAVITLIPLLFVPIRNDIGLSYTSLATLVSINFITQLITDLALSRAADKYGYKPFVLLSNALIFSGFILFSLSSLLFANPYIGFVIATVLFSIGGGLIEILISPLINSLPSKSKASSMALLHSAYGIGLMFVIIITSLFIHFAGAENWRIIIALWSILPFINLVLYLFSRFPQTHKEGGYSSNLSKVVRHPIFIFCLLIIFFGAGAENTMVQWSSTFMEKAMLLPKLLGDSLGIFMFALMLTLCRLIFGFFGDRINLQKLMLVFSMLTIFCYGIIALTSYPAIGLIACALTGFFTAMLWPGALILADNSFPHSGAWIFAFMAFAGDCGAAFCPWFAGLLSDNAHKISALNNLAESLEITKEQLGLRSGMILSMLYPILTALFIALYIYKAKQKSKDNALCKNIV